MDPLHNYNECVEIESARCEARTECQGNEAFDQSYPDFDHDTCITYAKEHCRTRKIDGTNWEQGNVDACAAAITALSENCDALIPRGNDETEAIRECWFIDGLDTAEPEMDTVDTNSDPDTDSPDGGD